jgi:hypothetical protein
MVLILAICLLVLLCTTVIALSQTPTAIPTIDPATIPTIPPMVGSVVRGFVLDSDGIPVPGANVTLWQNGNVWQHGKMVYVKADNPQTSYIYSDEQHPQEYAITGLFWFGLVEPGRYVLTAEKDGYKGSTTVSVGDDMINTSFTGFSAPKIMVNVTLEGYHVPVLTQGQLSYTGGITGTLRTYWGYGAAGVNMSLWQNGQLVTIPDNPQASHGRDWNGSEIDFLFEHLAPGQYDVLAEYYSPFRYVENSTVTVGDRIEMIHIVLSHILNSITTTPSPTPPAVSTLPTSRPAPFPGIAAVLISLGIAVQLYSIFRKIR